MVVLLVSTIEHAISLDFMGFHGIRIFSLTNFHELSFGLEDLEGLFRMLDPNPSPHKVDDQPAAVVEVTNILGF